MPTFTAYAVTKLLEAHFADYVDTEFTARLEQKLDDIATGELAWKEQLEQFYFGDGNSAPGLEGQIASQEPLIEYPSIEVGRHPESDDLIAVRIGRYGPYLQQRSADDEKVSASIPEDIAPADLTLDEAIELCSRRPSAAPRSSATPKRRRTSF